MPSSSVHRAAVSLILLGFACTCYGPQRYSKDRFSMVIERGWFLESDLQTGEGRHISLEGPYGATIDVRIMPNDLAPDLEDLSSEYAQIFAQNCLANEDIRPAMVSPIQACIGDQIAAGIREEWNHAPEAYAFNQVRRYLMVTKGAHRILVIFATPAHHEIEHNQALQHMLDSLEVKG